MGTWVTGIITCRKEDRKLAEYGGFNEVYDEGDSWIRLMGEVQPDPEQFRSLAPCLAWLGANPNDMDPLLVAWDGMELRYVPSDCDEFPVVRVEPDGLPENVGLESTRRYLVIEKKVKEILGIKEET